jgi:hypothetical protein
MTEHFADARNGEPTVIADGNVLHSRYDPSAEADRFIDANPLPPGTSTVVIIEPGLEYLAEAARKRYPSMRILCVHCSDFCRGAERSALEPERRFYGEAPGPDLDGFLGRWISDFDAARTRVLQWRPSMAAYGQRALRLLEAVTAHLSRAAANARTTAGFGRRWIRNTLAFAQEIRSCYVPASGTCPVVLAASGPSLEDAIREIRKARERGPIYVVAVSSAAEALLAGGVRPDLVAWTDGGQWASFHLRESLRRGIRLSAACSAIHPSGIYDRPILVMRDESRFQAAVAETIGIPTFAFPQRGTVAAAALDLAQALSSGPIYLAGFDMRVVANKTHARPNALDRFVEDTASRLVPSATGHYARFLSARDGPALRIYAQWFARRLEKETGRVILLGSGESFPAVRAEREIKVDRKGIQPCLEARDLQGPGDRKGLARRILAAVDAALDAELAVTATGGLPEAEGLWRELAGQLIPDEYAEALAEDRMEKLAPASIRRIDAALRAELRNIAEKGAR